MTIFVFEFRVQIDKPLKRRMKIRKARGDWFWINFKYKHVPTFCFIHGLLGHSEKFCSRIFEMPLTDIVKPYGPWMQALPRRESYLNVSKWMKSGSVSQVSMVDDGTSRNVLVTEVGRGRKPGIQTEDPHLKEDTSEIIGIIVEITYIQF